jgi:hypothetical protein
MRAVLLTIIFSCLIFGCTKSERANDESEVTTDSLSALQFPIVIEGGKRIVYQFSKMTPRGPIYFLDTVANTAAGLNLASLKPNFLFPIALTEEERNAAPAIIAISLPGYFEETVFGVIDSRDRLRMRYKDSELYLQASEKVSYRDSFFKSSFTDDALQVIVDAALTETSTGTHYAGAGHLTILEQDSVVQKCEIFLVCKKPD